MFFISVGQTITCASRLFECTATMTASPKLGEPFEVSLALVGHDPVHARLLGTGKLEGRIELKDKRTHVVVHEATAAFDAEGIEIPYPQRTVWLKQAPPGA